jgi:uncharacterized protein YidB (DUF937 family)
MYGVAAIRHGLISIKGGSFKGGSFKGGSHMGLFDNVGNVFRGMFGQTEAGATPALIAAALAKSDLGNLNGIVAKLQQGGLGDEVASWFGSGANLPVSAEQLRNALGKQQVRELAGNLGLPVDAALNVLSAHLPNLVDQASPNGSLSSGS